MALYASSRDKTDDRYEEDRGITWDSNTYPGFIDGNRIHDVRIQVSHKLEAFVLARYQEASRGNLCRFSETNPGLWGEFWISEVGQELKLNLVEKWGERWASGFREDQLPLCINCVNEENDTSA